MRGRAAGGPRWVGTSEVRCGLGSPGRDSGIEEVRRAGGMKVSAEGREGARPRLWSAPREDGAGPRGLAGCRVPKAGLGDVDTAQAHVGSWAAWPAGDPAPRHGDVPGPRDPADRRPGPADRRPDPAAARSDLGGWGKRPPFLRAEAHAAAGRRGWRLHAPRGRPGRPPLLTGPVLKRGRAADWDEILTLGVKRCRSQYLGVGRFRWGVRAAELAGVQGVSPLGLGGCSGLPPSRPGLAQERAQSPRRATGADAGPDRRAFRARPACGLRAGPLLSQLWPPLTFREGSGNPESGSPEPRAWPSPSSRTNTCGRGTVYKSR